jgi:hypothetical protein
MTSQREADRAWIQSGLPMLAQAGFLKLPVRNAPDGAALQGLIDECAQAFVSFIQRGGFEQPAGERGTGQAGVVQQGGEGDGRVTEIRSHVVVPWSVSRDHPLSVYWPYFYHRTELPAALASPAERLVTRLRAMTEALFNEIETAFGIPSSVTSDAVVHGEGILRFHYYPPLSGELRTVEHGAGHTPIRQVVCEASPNNYCTWVSPHTDIGQWTWQVAASDTRLAFDDGRTVVHPQEPGDLIGNACTYLADASSAIRAPMHWVDLGRPGPASRWSIAYFVHARPGVQLGGRPAGTRLYEDLCQLGYGTSQDVENVRRMLAQPECGDEFVLQRIREHDMRRGMRTG